MTYHCKYELWEHGQSGEVFAIRLAGGKVTGCCGPLLSNQLYRRELPKYPYDESPEYLAWIERHRENWSRSELYSPPRYY